MIARLDQRRRARTLRTRFRRDPQAYLRALEQKAIQLTLPASFFQWPWGRRSPHRSEAIPGTTPLDRVVSFDLLVICLAFGA